MRMTFNYPEPHETPFFSMLPYHVSTPYTGEEVTNKTDSIYLLMSLVLVQSSTNGNYV